MAGSRAPVFAVSLALLAATVAVPAALIAGLHRFDGLYGQDAFAYAGYALGPLRDALLAGRSLPDFPLPPGYPLLVALASLLAGPFDGVAQGVSLVAGASVPVLVALLALEIWPDADRRVAFLAGAISAVTGQLWQSSLVGMSDTSALAVALVGVLAACRFHRNGRGRWLLLAGGVLALAIEIRLVYGAVAIVFTALALVRLRVGFKARSRGALLLAGEATIAVLAVLAPMLGPILGAVAAGRPAPFLVELGVARYDPLTPFRATFETADGHLAYGLPMAAWYALQPFQPYWLGVLALGVPIGLIRVLRARPWRAVEVAVLVGWPALMGLALVSYPYQNTRFVLGLLPPLALLAACGLAWAWDRVARDPRHRGFATGLIVVLLVVGAAFAWRHADAFVARQSADLAAIRSLAARVPADAQLVSLGATPVLRHDGRAVTELYYLTVPEADALAASGPTYVLVDVEALTGQWASTTRGLVFERLRTNAGLTTVDAGGVWTLFVTNPKPGGPRVANG